MTKRFSIGSSVVLALFIGTAAQAEVVIETVTVDNPGNVGELSGEGAGGWGQDRICGAVDYVYDIGTFEVTAGQYRDFLNAVDPTGANLYGLYRSSMDSSSSGCQITWNAGSSTYDFSGRPSGTEADWVNRPVTHISWGDAARFCNWLHNGQPTGAQDLTTTEDGSYYLNGATSDAALMAVVRKPDATWVIPSADEWYKAAYHRNDGVTANYYDYPTSSDAVPGYVNDSGNLSGTGETFTEGGTDPGNYATYDGDSGTNGIGVPYYRTKVGEWENSESPYGTFDQGGNVSEWNEAVIVVLYRGIGNGAFVSSGDYLHAAGRIGWLPTYEHFYFGFRVADVSAECGNGLAEFGEACDDGNGDDTDACVDECVNATCHDGYVWAGVEECDDGVDNSDTEPDACRTDCRQAWCGDGVVDTGEECDDGNTELGDGCGESCGIEFGACCVGTACSAVAEGDCLNSGWSFFGFNSTCDVPDADGDGLRDECDGCPDDWNKIEPGICGCGRDDNADSDGDGVADCVDQCTGVDDTVYAPGCIEAVPTVSEWGLLIITLLLLTGSKVCFGRRRSAQD